MSGNTGENALMRTGTARVGMERSSVTARLGVKGSQVQMLSARPEGRVSNRLKNCSQRRSPPRISVGFFVVVGLVLGCAAPVVAFSERARRALSVPGATSIATSMWRRLRRRRHPRRRVSYVVTTAPAPAEGMSVGSSVISRVFDVGERWTSPIGWAHLAAGCRNAEVGLAYVRFLTVRVARCALRAAFSAAFCCLSSRSGAPPGRVPV